jgi:hypothetical protein
MGALPLWERFILFCLWVLIYLFLIIVALYPFLFLFGFRDFVLRRKKSLKKSRGKIIDQKEKEIWVPRAGTLVFMHPIIEYMYSDESIVQVESTIGCFKWDIPVGKTVTIYYDRSDKNVVHIAQKDLRLLGKCIQVIFSIPFSIGSFLLLILEFIPYIVSLLVS